MLKYVAKIISAIIILICAIALYILIHGTNNLAIVNIINSIKNIIPVFDGINCKSIFIRCYLVDILWFVSFIILGSVSKKEADSIVHSFSVLVVAICLELLQLFSPKYGTFDFFDIFTYILIYIIYILVEKKYQNTND